MTIDIIYTDHIKSRIEERVFPYDYPKKIYLTADSHYHDRLQDSLIAVKSLMYNGKIRPIMVAYTINNDSVIIITIHPETDKEIEKRVKNLRWIKV